MEEVKTVLLPNFGSGNTNVTDTIIYVLCNEWPLTAKALHFKAKKECSKTFSYQASYKALQRLMENKVVEKRNNRYLLNTHWLDEINDFSRIIKERYNKNQPVD